MINASEKWILSLPNGGLILNQLHILFGELLNVYLCSGGLYKLIVSAKIVIVPKTYLKNKQMIRG